MCPNQTWPLLWETSGSSMNPWPLQTCRRRRSGTDPRSENSEMPFMKHIALRSRVIQHQITLDATVRVPLRRLVYSAKDITQTQRPMNCLSLYVVCWPDRCSQSKRRSLAPSQAGGQWISPPDPSGDLWPGGSPWDSKSTKPQKRLYYLPLPSSVF